MAPARAFAPAPDTTGMTERLGSYELVKKIAQGGMAEVFLANQIGDLAGFSRQIAIKRIYPHLAHEPDLITMFYDEARIASRLNHPNIAQIYELGEERGYFYIAMEFVHGCDLRSLCEHGIKRANFLPLNLAVRIIADAAAGLHYAHTRLDERGKPMNIVHRDISPQNILVGMNGAVKLCDFGIAKAESRMSHTRTGQFKGKFAYMSPEQVIGDGRPLDHRSDIFSLGIVLYEITVCTRLFRARNDYETIKLVTDATVPRPTAARADFPPDLERIILRALSKDPALRYQTAEQLQSDLEDWLLDHRARTSAMHIARYMGEVLPELVEQQLYPNEFDATRPELAVDHQRLAAAAKAVGIDLADLDQIDATRPVRISDAEPPTDPLVKTLTKHEDMDEDATHDINAASFRQQLIHDRLPPLDDQTYPQHNNATPPPRERQMTPMGYSGLGVNLQRPQHPGDIQLQPPQENNLRWTAPLPAVPRDPPGAWNTSSDAPAHHPFIPNAPLLGQLAQSHELANSSGSSMELAIHKLRLDRNQRTLRYSALAAVCILLLVGLALAISYGAGNKDALTVPPKPKLPALPSRLHMPIGVPLATDPEGAQVIINGQLAQGTTPGIFQLAEGQANEAIFFLDNHRPQRTIVDGVAAGPADPAQLTAETPVLGKLAIQTTPEGAQISINGDRVAQTPLRLETIRSGMEHHIVLEKDGLGRVGAFVSIVAGTPALLEHTMRPPDGTSLVDVILDGTPRGAVVTVNGEPRAQLPATITLSRDGLHTIRIEARDHEPAEHILQLDGYAAFIWQAHLNPIIRERGSVAIQIAGAQGSTVFIGNNSYGKSPIRKVELPEGDYPITIQQPSGARHEGTIIIYPNLHTRYRLTPGPDAALAVERQR
jgi:serine/threonine protein kinase